MSEPIILCKTASIVVLSDIFASCFANPNTGVAHQSKTLHARLFKTGCIVVQPRQNRRDERHFTFLSDALLISLPSLHYILWYTNLSGSVLIGVWTAHLSLILILTH